MQDLDNVPWRNTSPIFDLLMIFAFNMKCWFHHGYHVFLLWDGRANFSMFVPAYYAILIPTGRPLGRKLCHWVSGAFDISLLSLPLSHRVCRPSSAVSIAWSWTSVTSRTEIWCYLWFGSFHNRRVPLFRWWFPQPSWTSLTPQKYPLLLLKFGSEWFSLSFLSSLLSLAAGLLLDFVFGNLFCVAFERIVVLFISQSQFPRVKIRFAYKM